MHVLILVVSILFLFNCGGDGILGDNNHGRNDLVLEKENNNKISEAQLLDLPVAIHGHVHDTSDKLDLFSFTVGSITNVSIVLSGFADDLDLTLLNNLGNIIQRSLNDAPNNGVNESIDTNAKQPPSLDPGTYFIQIEAIDTQEDLSHYTLDVLQL